MTDEEKVSNGRNSRASQHIRRFDIETIVEKHEPIIKTAEEKLQDVSGNLLRSPDLEQSIYQVGVPADDAADAATTTTPAPGDADITSAPADAPADPMVTEPATEAAPTEDQTPETQAPAVEGAPEASQDQEPEPGQEPTQQPTSDDADENREEPVETESTGETLEGVKRTEEGVKTTEADGDKSTDGTIDQTTTAEPQVKDPYRIDIPLEKKINKRTQRKLWEEIEKRKPLIPKYVERHIQKYAKPPFELWGCKFRGKGSCYGCGG